MTSSTKAPEVPREEAALIERNHEQVFRGENFALYRRANEIILLSDDENRHRAWTFETATKAREYFNKSTAKSLYVEVPE